MGEDTRTSGSQVTDPSPEQLRHDIEETRDELGDTVAALAEKADVKAQAKRKANEAKASVLKSKDEVLEHAKQASPEGARSAASRMSATAKENPLPTAVAGAFFAGVLVGVTAGRKR